MNSLRRRWLCSGTVPVRCGRDTRLPGAGVRPTVASVLALVAGRARRCAMDAMGAASEAIMGLGMVDIMRNTTSIGLPVVLRMMRRLSRRRTASIIPSNARLIQASASRLGAGREGVPQHPVQLQARRRSNPWCFRVGLRSRRCSTFLSVFRALLLASF